MKKERINEILKELEEVRKVSEDGCTYYVLTNGEKIRCTAYLDTKQYLEDNEYWVCYAFKNGYMI